MPIDLVYDEIERVSAPRVASLLVSYRLIELENHQVQRVRRRRFKMYGNHRDCA